MRGIKRKIYEPGAPIFGFFFDEIDGGTGEKVRAVLPRAVDLHGILIQIMFTPVYMVVVMHITGSMAQEFIESAFGRSRPRGESDVPFAESASGIMRSTFFYDLGD